jgi:hypothetical protein
MAGITFLRGVSIASVSYAVGSTATPSFAIASQLVGEGAARWTNAACTRPLPNVCDRVSVLGDVTALTGDAPIGLNGYLVAGIPAGRMFEVKLAAENAPRRYMVITKSGETPDADGIIEPPDFDATGNNKLLLQIQ